MPPELLMMLEKMTFDWKKKAGVALNCPGRPSNHPQQFYEGTCTFCGGTEAEHAVADCIHDLLAVVKMYPDKLTSG